MKSRFWFFIIPVMVVFFEILCSCGGGGDSLDDENALRMQTFVMGISDFARGKKPGFIIIPQNGEELAFNYTDQSEGILWSYVNAIDGLGIEELFYNGILNIDGERLGMLKFLKKEKPALTIMVSDYVEDGSKISDAIKRSKDEGFIAFPRSENNYDYKFIPAGSPTDENSDTIINLVNAKNYLYLISTDGFNNKGEMITAINNTKYDIVLIDLFFDEEAFTLTEINSLKTKSGGGSRLVICYISIGSAEKYRYYWQTGWKIGNPSWIKKKYAGYPDEFWVEYWNDEWQAIIFGYIQKIIDAGFDGVYLDNVEAYYYISH